MNLLEGLPAREPVNGSAVSPGMRQAALLLHTLGSADRDWMLRQLPEAQRREVESLLGEVAELGLPADAQLLQDALATPLPRAATAVPESAQVQRLFDLSVQTAAELLHGEPDRLIAHVLGLAAWPWGPGTLDQLGPTRKRRVLELMAARSQAAQGASPRSACDLALLDELETKARRQLDPATAGTRGLWSAPPDARGLRGWVQRLRSTVAFGKGET